VHLLSHPTGKPDKAQKSRVQFFCKGLSYLLNLPDVFTLPTLRQGCKIFPVDSTMNKEAIRASMYVSGDRFYVFLP